jgi:hypothetical protein
MCFTHCPQFRLKGVYVNALTYCIILTDHTECVAITYKACVNEYIHVRLPQDVDYCLKCSVYFGFAVDHTDAAGKNH